MRLLIDVLEDLKQALRLLVRDKGFAATTLATFALCLGANVALFAVVNAVLLRPLPFPEPDRVVGVNNAYPKAGVVDPIGTSVPLYLERKNAAAFESIAAYRWSGETIGEAGSPDRVESFQVTPSFFPALKVQAKLGRTFTEEEGNYGKHQVAILSDAMWRQRFGAAPDVVGKTVRTGGGGSLTIVGVMGPEFRFLNSKAQLWTPLCFSDEDRKLDNRHANNMNMLARLKPGATAAEAEAQVAALNEAGYATDPYAKLVRDAGFVTKVEGLQSLFTSKMKPVVLLLQGGVLLLLLIGVINLANLYLVRTSARAKDLALRQVLGAGWGVMARQSWLETTLLAVGGSLLGLAVGWMGLQGLESLGADDLPHTGRFELDATVVAVSLAAAVLLGTLLAVPGILASRRQNLALALSVESRGGTTTRAANRLRHGLIVGQMALAFVLLADAGMLVRSFSEVTKVQPGFQTQNVISGSVPLPWDNYKDDVKTLDFVQRVEAELRGKPGLVSVGVTTSLPFSGRQNVNGISVEGYVMKEGDTLRAHPTSGVSGDYFSAMGIPLVEGRFLNDDDTAKREKVCVIDTTMAKLYWPEGNALGHRLVNGADSASADKFTIVGIVGPVKHNDLTDEQKNGAVYFSYGQYIDREPMFVVRTALAAESAGPLLRAAVAKADPELPVTDFKTLEERVERSLLGRRSPMLLALIFAAVALVLAAVGLYGVLVYAVSQRRREIGVRMALGAAPEAIRRQFTTLGLKLVAAGVSIGIVGAWLSGYALRSLLFGVGTVSVPVMFVTGLLLGGVTLAACLVPAMRASRVSPVEVLRG